MKYHTYHKGFIGVGVIVAVVVAFVIGGGIVYYATQPSAPGSNYMPTDQNGNVLSVTTDANSAQSDTSTAITVVPNQPSVNSGETQSDTQNSPISVGVSPQSFFVVNAESGVNVVNPVFTVNGNTYQGINNFLLYMNTVVPGTYSVNVSASGYESMTGITIAVPANLTDMVINLEPVVSAHNCPRNPSNANNFFLCGYVADENHNALAGVQVSSSGFGGTPVVAATTSADGYYQVEFTPLQNNDCSNPFTIYYSTENYKSLSYILRGLYVYPGGDLSTRIQMNQGTGEDQEIVKHGMCS
ncbi:MAG: hypothetical protein K9M36_03240 [Candidatus Pacebacteria bacterium]|nr:hypothetical protein [Candidatus Paceibacterota bacterium]